MVRSTYTHFNNLEEQVEMNHRIYTHTLPSLTDVARHNAMEPAYSMRATTTRQTLLQPTVQTKFPLVPRHVYKSYAQASVPAVVGMTGGPYSGYSTQVDTETVLRNQVMPLRRSDDKVYIPSTHSDLYQTNQAVESNRRAEVQTRQFSGLFTEPTFRKHNPNVLGGGGDVFANHTRQQRG
jgi:hypothetical protein